MGCSVVVSDAVWMRGSPVLTMYSHASGSLQEPRAYCSMFSCKVLVTGTMTIQAQTGK